MARWDPDAEGRLRQAAIELFIEHGYAAVTITQIAERAGLTRRSYFRYFPDKREVLFAGSEKLITAVAQGLETTDRSAPPLVRIIAMFEDVGEQMIKYLGHAADRRTIIASSTELTERDRTKMAAVAEALTARLVAEGQDRPLAALAGRVGVDLFQSAFDRYLDDSRSTRNWPFHLARAVEDLTILSAESGLKPIAPRRPNSAVPAARASLRSD